MQKYFVPHKLKVGDITNLSDKDSEFVISEKLFKIEDPIQVETLEGVFLTVITHIGKSSVEVEIVEKISNTVSETSAFSVTILQSISGDFKFNFFLEKAVEIGVHKIVPIESRFSLIPKKKALKKLGLYQKIVKEAKEQSRNPYDVEIEKPINIKSLKKINSKNKLCFATEVKNPLNLEKSLSKKDPNSSYTIAIGPERGWSVSDIKVFEELGFEFVRLKGNILRTETAGLVIASILNFRAGKY
jgi:16S rRNA (uracil1498-N3)-methyltransferase